jgi:D-glycero-D-manno-heptose 1,7-bisphosphate phosphatase
MPISSLTGERMVPVLYCDIDGTIRKGKDELGRFVNTAEDVQLFDGVKDLLWKYKRLGWRIVGISNQGGIALGHMTRKDCRDAMTETHKQTGYAFSKLVWCIHHPDASPPEMAVCWCRKPRPGLIVEAALDLSQTLKEIYPPHLALFVGDRPEDEQCAANAGIRFMWAHHWREGKHFDEIKRAASAS